MLIRPVFDLFVWFISFMSRIPHTFVSLFDSMTRVSKKARSLHHTKYLVTRFSLSATVCDRPSRMEKRERERDDAKKVDEKKKKRRRHEY